MTDPNQFAEFMRAYQNMVFSTAVRLVGNEAQAEDISQEVFLKAYERYDSLQASPTAGGWLKTVATNLSLNHLSRYRNRWRFFSEFRRDDSGGGSDSEQPEVEFAAPDTFFAGVDAGERHEWLSAALEKLPEHQRVPLVLFHFEDMPYDEIAKRLRISLAKVKTDILRARASLPWWKQSFAQWPMAARCVFLLLSGGLVKVALMITVWVMGGFERAA